MSNNHTVIELNGEKELIVFDAVSLAEHSIKTLVVVYNHLCPAAPLKSWKNSKGELIVRILAQSDALTWEPEVTPEEPKTVKARKRSKLAGPFRVLEAITTAAPLPLSELSKLVGATKGSVRSYISYLCKGHGRFPQVTIYTKGGLVYTGDDVSQVIIDRLVAAEKQSLAKDTNNG